MRLLFFGVALLSLSGCTGGDKAAAPATSESGGAAGAPTVKITQFYATKPGIAKGEASLLCYGVEGAAKVRIDPPVQELSPALTRCFEVKPSASTTYTLTAEGRDGSTVTMNASVQVGGARPRLYDLSVNKDRVRAGAQVQFCFKAQNATSVTGGPGSFLRGGVAERDCLMDRPAKTTTYTITVSNAQQLTDSASMKVEVLP